MIKWIKENKRKTIFGAIAILVVVPLIIYLLSTLPILPSGDNNDWAGFWGGYLGSMIGSIIALYILFKTLAEERKRQRRQERLSYCDYIVERIAEFSQAMSFAITKINKYYTFAIALKSDISMYEEAIEAVNSIVGCNLVLSAQLGSRLDKKDYKHIREIMIITNRISELFNPIGEALNENKIHFLKQEDFKVILNNVQNENKKLCKVATEFIENNVES